MFLQDIKNTIKSFQWPVYIIMFFLAGSKRNLDKPTEDTNHDNSNNDTPKKQDDDETMQDSSILSERRRALFEPLEPLTGARTSAESLLPPPDFDSANYPRGWLIGKKRKLVNVDVVESMRRIAVQEMNRKVFSLLYNACYSIPFKTSSRGICNMN